MARSKLRNLRDYRPGTFVFFDNNTSHFKAIGAYGYYDLVFNTVSMGMPSNGYLIGYTVLCDRNRRLIVTIVSSSSGDYTFRFYNPTNASQTIAGLVMIGLYLQRVGGVTKGLQLRTRRPVARLVENHLTAERRVTAA